jgi:hypothetical protein
MNRVLVTLCVVGVVLMAGCLGSLTEFGHEEFPEPSDDPIWDFDDRPVESYDARLGGVTSDGEVRFYRADSGEPVTFALVDVTLVGHGPQDGVPQTLDVTCEEEVTTTVEEQLTVEDQSISSLYTVIVVQAENGTAMVGDAYLATDDGDAPALSEMLVRDGLAVYTPAADSTENEYLVLAQEEAREEEVGVWGCPESPPLK